MIRKPKGQQHHGNLKEALVLAGLEILEEEGLDGLTLRKCAARAGVSHAAPAHHFDGLGALKSAIATRAYALFEESLLAGIKNAGESPAEKVKGLCNGYIEFSTEHNALLNLIFVSPGTYPPDPEREAAATLFRRLTTINARSVPRTTAAPWAIIRSSVTGRVLLSPCTTMPRNQSPSPSFRQSTRRKDCRSRLRSWAKCVPQP